MPINNQESENRKFEKLLEKNRKFLEESKLLSKQIKAKCSVMKTELKRMGQIDVKSFKK